MENWSCICKEDDIAKTKGDKVSSNKNILTLTYIASERDIFCLYNADDSGFD